MRNKSLRPVPSEVRMLAFPLRRVTPEILRCRFQYRSTQRVTWMVTSWVQTELPGPPRCGARRRYPRRAYAVSRVLRVALSKPRARGAAEGRVYRVGMPWVPPREAVIPLIRALEDGLRERGYGMEWLFAHGGVSMRRRVLGGGSHPGEQNAPAWFTCVNPAELGAGRQGRGGRRILFSF